ncbi:MAG TPA: hypothetical protein VGH10_09165 [Actinomycetota bacterium]
MQHPQQSSPPTDSQGTSRRWTPWVIGGIVLAVIVAVIVYLAAYSGGSGGSGGGGYFVLAFPMSAASWTWSRIRRRADRNGIR